VTERPGTRVRTLQPGGHRRAVALDGRMLPRALGVGRSPTGCNPWRPVAASLFNQNVAPASRRKRKPPAACRFLRVTARKRPTGPSSVPAGEPSVDLDRSRKPEGAQKGTSTRWANKPKGDLQITVTKTTADTGPDQRPVVRRHALANCDPARSATLRGRSSGSVQLAPRAEKKNGQGSDFTNVATADRHRRQT